MLFKLNGERKMNKIIIIIIIIINMKLGFGTH
jgi:hypothetical protein